jgi:hypothetical protein
MLAAALALSVSQILHSGSRQLYAVEPKIGIKPEAQQPSLHRPLWNDAKSAEDWLQKSASFDSPVSYPMLRGKDHFKSSAATLYF